MLTVTATNFGLAPSDIKIKEYSNTNLLVLEGEFTVDTTAEEYSGIRPMQLTVADLPFSKSLKGSALVTVLSEGIKYATITQVWVKDKNTICIDKIINYKSSGSYKVRLNTILIPEKVTGEVILNQKTVHTPSITKGEAAGLEVFSIQSSDWVMLTIVATSLTFDSDSQTVELSISDFPEGISSGFPVLYNEGLSTSLGSKYYPATIENGSIVISKDGNADEAEGTGNKFTRIVFIR